MEKYKRNAIFAELNQFCSFADKNDFIEITEWKNDEGIDVEISGKLQQRFQLTHGEFKALKKLMKKLKKDEK